MTEPATIHRLTVLYDGGRAFGRWCHDWLREDQTLVPIDLADLADPVVRRRFGDEAWLEWDLIVVADDGRVWVGAAAFVTCLWATARFHRLASTVRPKGTDERAEALFHRLRGLRPTFDRFVRATFARPTVAAARP